MTQNNLGNALATLGLRESGTARLQEATAAYRAALQERTRERVPLDWAGTQNNLGNALRILGERESGTARLKEAVTAFEACLTVTETAWPEEWVEHVRSHRDETRAEIMRRRGTN
jgi:tetratricopeptide (TPR) repeat protein